MALVADALCNMNRVLSQLPSFMECLKIVRPLGRQAVQKSATNILFCQICRRGMELGDAPASRAIRRRHLLGGDVVGEDRSYYRLAIPAQQRPQLA